MAPKNPSWSRDEVVLAAEVCERNGWKSLSAGHPDVIELSALLQKGPIPLEDRDEKFRNPDGVGRKTADIATRHPDYTGKKTNGGSWEEPVIAEFLADPERMHAQARKIRALFESGEFVRQQAPEFPDAMFSDVMIDDDGIDEGSVLVKSHAMRERNPKLRRRKLAAVRAARQPLACEVCGLSAQSHYRGLVPDDGILDVHHILPLSMSGPTVTRLKDLALLCPTCHRTIHRMPTWTTPAELKGLLEST